MRVKNRTFVGVFKGINTAVRFLIWTLTVLSVTQWGKLLRTVIFDWHLIVKLAIIGPLSGRTSVFAVVFGWWDMVFASFLLFSILQRSVVAIFLLDGLIIEATLHFSHTVRLFGFDSSFQEYSEQRSRLFTLSIFRLAPVDVGTTC